ncbi:restriction endonuclease subunit S [Aquabacterium sp. A08]|uniref:restriction endonuclease subunit S n=1 Tax=Aquabacterium sp. A08 TaxID=2718532 RepID=UPI001423D21F|nr:restriction endonuclease subunit S [Aquabacterium sp. A08]NIC42294.1 restriction endonuclease subunit S [Aquabacterium sp. A08]
MSHYKPYPAYKDSGVEWLGEVPEHWVVKPIKSLANSPGACFIDGDWIESKNLSGSGIRYITTGNVGPGTYKEQGSGYISEETFNELQCIDVRQGDILISRLNPPIGRACIVPDLGGRVVTSVDNVIFRPSQEFLVNYVVYRFSAADYFHEMGLLASGATMQRISRTELGSVRIAWPSMDEQLAIASHLDRETTRIDALITKKTRFIELLREKRQALITHAVAKGLDPNVKMKDSGVEWLGEVPEHWGIQPLKQLARLDGGAGFPDDEQGIQDAPIPFFKVADLSNGMTSAENYITPETADKLRAKIFPAGTIAFAKVGAALLLNRRVLMSIPGCADNNMMVAIPHGILGTWLHAVLSCYDMAWLVNPGAVPSVNQEQVGNIKIPVPSVEEQRSIVASVSSGTMRIDRIVVKTERSIELLKERRTAIITAAVTGQIDLREAS